MLKLMCLQTTDYEDVQLYYRVVSLARVEILRICKIPECAFKEH